MVFFSILQKKSTVYRAERFPFKEILVSDYCKEHQSKLKTLMLITGCNAVYVVKTFL